MPQQQMGTGTVHGVRDNVAFQTKSSPKARRSRSPGRAAPPAASTHGKRVAIVGGGLSGLAYAGVLRDLGFDCVVFEKSGAVGGHW